MLNPLSSAPQISGIAVQRVNHSDGINAEPKTANPVPEKPEPKVDRYEPGEPHSSAGLYWPERDANGNPTVHFDSPDRNGEPEAESATYNTDKVDREIESLKERIEKLKQQLERETNPEKAMNLEKKLSQLETELQRKDTDGYRRQHADKA